MREITVLCIGGKHDGRRVKCEAHTPVVYFPNQTETAIYSYVDDISHTLVTNDSAYCVEILRSKDREFYIGRPPDQTLDSTMSLLIQGYRGV
jgi:hypothetical protein